MELIQGVLNKLFDGIVRLEIDSDVIQGMYSKEKEFVKFSKPQKVTASIE